MYLGIDIASVDGNKPINWQNAKSAGVKFAYFRATWKDWQDPTWQIEATRARQAGLTVGAYLFPVMDETAPSVETQVNTFIQAVSKTPGDLPVALDVEYARGIAATGHTRAELLKWIRKARDLLKAFYGYWCVIYTSQRVWDDSDFDSLDVPDLHQDTSDFKDCPLWLARYPFATRIDAQDNPSVVDSLTAPPVPKTWGDHTNVWIHQYQGDSINLPGFSSTVDLNRFFDLHQGMSGDRVKWLQRKLKITEDGSFGPITLKAVQAFQTFCNLVADGVVGPKTFAYLCA